MREELLSSISSTISDYREGEIPAPTPEHVDRWVSRFDTSVQEPILQEMDHILEQTYIPRNTVRTFLGNLAKNPKITGDDPENFWQSANFLDIQQGGSSQSDLLDLFGEILETEFDIEIEDCESADGPHFYFDDVIFSGARVKQDLCNWIRGEAPSTCIIHVIVIAYHQGGWYAKSEIRKAITASDKNIKVHWWSCVQYENRKTYKDRSDVLWPTVIPEDPGTIQYAQMLTGGGYPPELRTPGEEGPNNLFSSEDARFLLEQEFLKKGVVIRELCPLLPEVCRPLGFYGLKTFGFGGLVVTYRNCPNTTPLAFWVDDPWYPLFSRKTN